MTAPDAGRLAEAEALLAVSLPTTVRELYRESDGYVDDDGRWFVVWPVGRLVEENLAAWDLGLPRTLLAFGDDGAGNLFCVDLVDPADAVVRWSWVDGDVECHEGSLAEFRSTWLARSGW